MWQKIKQLCKRVIDRIYVWLYWMQEQLTPEQGTLIAVGTLVSGIAFMEMIGAWFAAPFFFIGAILLAFDFKREEPQYKWFAPQGNQLEHVIDLKPGVDYN